MTLPATSELLPASYTFGKVVGRIIHLIADTAADADDKPEARPAAGKIRFYPDQTLSKTVEENYPAIVLRATESVTLDADGYLHDAEGRRGVWMAVGTYRVSFEITGAPNAVPDFSIAVTSDNDEDDPLDLAVAVPYVPPTGQAVQTVLVPAGGSTGQMLVRTESGGLEWRTVVLADTQLGGDLSGTIDDATVMSAGGLTFSDASGEPTISNDSTFGGDIDGAPLRLGNALGQLRIVPFSDGKTYVQSTQGSMTFSGLNGQEGLVLVFSYGETNFTGSASAADQPTLPGHLTRKDYVDQEIADAVAAFDPTVQAADITDSTAVGRSLIKAADGPAARSAIGAGTSNLAIGTTSTTAKAGDYQPTAANISDATTVGRNVLKAADGPAARAAIGAGTSDLAIGTTSTTAKAGNYAPAAADISDATTVGRNVLKASNAAAGRTALGAGVVDSSDSTVTNVVKLTQAAYTALATKVATTLYVIVG